ncbi:MAG TPA: DMT family transporter [Phycisphaerae bacterium]|nr:DMT family transporter [Phycisphaerae bacterium]HNU46293.1 DMT family transporter [Phycisphaerae bacterium]
MPPSFEPYIGPAAGLLASCLWTGTSLLFTAASRRLGPTAVNALRIWVAVLLLAGVFWLRTRSWVPSLEPQQVLYLALSGVVGLSIGDQALFTAYVDVGPRIAMLVMATAPLMATLFGWLGLGETLGPWAWGGVILTIGGVTWVVLERPAQARPAPPGLRVRGVTLAFVATVCQAGGYLLSKQGMGHGWLPEDRHLDPQAATLVRMFFAGLGMLPILLLHGWRQHRRRAEGVVPVRVGSPSAGVLLALGGAVAGPTLGVWMSLVATDRAPLGVAQTLCSLPPVFILPFAVLIHKEHISARAVLGALIAVGGCALLFL